MTLIKIENQIVNVNQIIDVRYYENGDLKIWCKGNEGWRFKFEGDKARWLWKKLSHMCMHDYDVDAQSDEAYEAYLAEREGDN